jgi:low temperature requirement protein LtrA
VADEFVLRDPLGRTLERTTIAVLGSTGLYLLGILLFLWAVTGRLPKAPVIGLALTLAFAIVARYLPPVVLMAVTSVVLLATALHESTSSRSRDYVVPVP